MGYVDFVFGYFLWIVGEVPFVFHWFGSGGVGKFWIIDDLEGWCGIVWMVLGLDDV